ncbi:YbaK/EbsC family protein [Candidatus Woesearchaeota archaeon]|nr:YbaK/EbsC family protein [Candidatus Woesearchaeota archaeon]
MSDELVILLEKHKVDAQLVQTGSSVKTVEQSCALGVKPEMIIKTLVFLWQKPVIVLVRGDCMADEEVLEKMFPGIKFANANEVRKTTGYGPGDVPPLMDGDFIRVMDKKVADGDVFDCGGGKERRHLRISVHELRRVQEWTVVVVSNEKA